MRKKWDWIIKKQKQNKPKKTKNYWALEGGLEPPTLWLTATRSSQLSYSSFVVTLWTQMIQILNIRIVRTWKSRISNLWRSVFGGNFMVPRETPSSGSSSFAGARASFSGEAFTGGGGWRWPEGESDSESSPSFGNEEAALSETLRNARGWGSRTWEGFARVGWWRTDDLVTQAMAGLSSWNG